MVIVVGPAEQATPATFDEALVQVQTLVAEGTRLKTATRQVAQETGHSARELYNAALTEQ